MTDTLFADVSYFQRPLNDDYPHQFVSFRANDGTFQDPNFDLNLAWAAKNVRRRIRRPHRKPKLTGFCVYFVYEENADATIATLLSMLGKRKWFTRDRFAKMAVMLDVESWHGKISGDHSDSIRYVRERVIRELNNRRLKIRRKRHYERDRKRVVIYGNTGDLSNIAPNIGDAQVVVAAYGANPDYPGKIAHQFSDHYPCPPFGYCDMNSADGYSPEEFAVALGLARPPRVKRRHKHRKVTPVRPPVKQLP